VANGTAGHKPTDRPVAIGGMRGEATGEAACYLKSTNPTNRKEERDKEKRTNTIQDDDQSLPEFSSSPPRASEASEASPSERSERGEAGLGPWVAEPSPRSCRS